MSNWPWKPIVTNIAAFIVGYGMTQMAEGYNTVALHWSWGAILYGLTLSGAYTGGLVQTPPSQAPKA